MARDSQAALVALNRFGFGARGGASGDFVNAASDPRGFVKAELDRPNGVLLEVPGLLSTPALGAGGVRLSVRGQAGARRRRENRRADAGPMPSTSRTRRRKRRAHGHGAGKSLLQTDGRRCNATHGRARCDAAQRAESRRRSRSTSSRKPTAPRRWRGCSAPTIADCGFVERLVVFWSNHFCISANKGELARMWAGSFEREAIRPHVLGRFGDMLKAVEQHPAMLFFLDNQQSLGPDSRAGQNRKRGLNENLAREIMELHTLGVGGGYSQDDVTSLARIITGWTYAGRQGQLGAPGSFVFNANAHQPGAQRLLGKTYENNGVAQGEAALADTRAPSLHREIHRHQIRAPFRGRRSAAGFGGAAAGRVPQIRRRPQGAGDRAGGFRRGLAGADDQAAQPLRIPGGDRAAAGAESRRIPAAISAASTCWASRCGRRPGRTDFPTPTPPGPRPRA